MHDIEDVLYLLNDFKESLRIRKKFIQFWEEVASVHWKWMELNIPSLKCILTSLHKNDAQSMSLSHYKRKGCLKWILNCSPRHKIISNDLWGNF